MPKPLDMQKNLVVQLRSAAQSAQHFERKPT